MLLSVAEEAKALQEVEVEVAEVSFPCEVGSSSKQSAVKTLTGAKRALKRPE